VYSQNTLNQLSKYHVALAAASMQNTDIPSFKSSDAGLNWQLLCSTIRYSSEAWSVLSNAYANGSLIKKQFSQN